MVNRSKKDSLAFKALQKLYNKQDCDVERKKQLKKHKLVNSDCSLTIEGKIVLYAGILEISVVAFKMLVMLYCYRKLQSAKNHMPLFHDIFLFLFSKKTDRHMRDNIQSLKNHNLAEKRACRYLRITDSAFDMLKKYDADITEIEKTF